MKPPFSLKRPKVKPVHLATGIFISRQGGFKKLIRLNKVAMHHLKIQKSGPHKGSVHPADSYESEKVLNELRSAGCISDRINRESLEIVRRALYQFVGNDQAAFHCYSPHKPFGNDYSISDYRLLTMDPSHPTDGGLGQIITACLSVSKQGEKVLEVIDSFLNTPSSLGDLASPFLEEEEMVTRSPFDFDPTELATLMNDQTVALSNLATHLKGNFTTETQARLIILGLSLWILSAMIKWSSNCCGNKQATRILLADFTQKPKQPIRKASCNSVGQVRRQLEDYIHLCKTSNPPVENPGDWASLFEYLGKRCGLIQPRSDKSRGRRYVEPMADTIRAVVMSCFAEDDDLLPFPVLAERMRKTWSIVIGAENDDPERIRQSGLGTLREDNDLAANVACFRERLEELQLAVRLSDGEHRCAALPENLP